MLEKAIRICDAKFGNIYRWDGEVLHLLAAQHAAGSRRISHAFTASIIGMQSRRMVATKTAIHVDRPCSRPRVP